MLKTSRLLFVFLSLIMSNLSAQDASNILIYNEGSVQVTTQVNAFEKILPGKPISGTIMITHDLNVPVDGNSFSMDGKPLKATLVKTVPMSARSKLVLSIYNFQIDGKPEGDYTLPPIKVKVGGKEYAAPPLTLQVGT